jgi:UDP-2,3-diacylglucosamine pyrophosphatase LpxH
MGNRVIIIDREFEYGDKFNTFFCGDIHLDSPGHDRRLFIEEMSEALVQNADIVILGDIFDLIQHGDHKRFTPSSNKYGATDTAMNSAIEEAVELLTPFAKNIKVMLCGNHESSAIKYHNIDMAAMLIWELNKLDGVDIQYMGMQGYIRFKYKHVKVPDKKSATYDVKTHHGVGGSAEITKGTITLNRFMAAYEADLHVMGHTHTKVVLPDERRAYVTRYGNIATKSVKGFIVGAYVHPVTQQKALISGRPNPYSIDFGDTRRTLQSTGGIMISQQVMRIDDRSEIRTKIIS